VLTQYDDDGDGDDDDDIGDHIYWQDKLGERGDRS